MIDPHDKSGVVFEDQLPAAGHTMPIAGCVPAQTQALWDELRDARREVARLQAALAAAEQQRDAALRRAEMAERSLHERVPHTRTLD